MAETFRSLAAKFGDDPVKFQQAFNLLSSSDKLSVRRTQTVPGQLDRITSLRQTPSGRKLSGFERDRFFDRLTASQEQTFRGAESDVQAQKRRSARTPSRTVAVKERIRTTRIRGKRVTIPTGLALGDSTTQIIDGERVRIKRVDGGFEITEPGQPSRGGPEFGNTDIQFAGESAGSGRRTIFLQEGSFSKGFLQGGVTGAEQPDDFVGPPPPTRTGGLLSLAVGTGGPSVTIKGEKSSEFDAFNINVLGSEGKVQQSFVVGQRTSGRTKAEGRVRKGEIRQRLGEVADPASLDFIGPRTTRAGPPAPQNIFLPSGSDATAQRLGGVGINVLGVTETKRSGADTSFNTLFDRFPIQPLGAPSKKRTLQGPVLGGSVRVIDVQRADLGGEQALNTILGPQFQRFVPEKSTRFQSSLASGFGVPFPDFFLKETRERPIGLATDFGLNFALGGGATVLFAGGKRAATAGKVVLPRARSRLPSLLGTGGRVFKESFVPIQLRTAGTVVRETAPVLNRAFVPSQLRFAGSVGKETTILLPKLTTRTVRGTARGISILTPPKVKAVGKLGLQTSGVTLVGGIVAADVFLSTDRERTAARHAFALPTFLAGSAVASNVLRGPQLFRVTTASKATQQDRLSQRNVFNPKEGEFGFGEDFVRTQRSSFTVFETSTKITSKRPTVPSLLKITGPQDILGFSGDSAFARQDPLGFILVPTGRGARSKVTPSIFQKQVKASRDRQEAFEEIVGDLFKESKETGFGTLTERVGTGAETITIPGFKPQLPRTAGRSTVKQSKVEDKPFEIIRTFSEDFRPGTLPKPSNVIIQTVGKVEAVLPDNQGIMGVIPKPRGKSITGVGEKILLELKTPEKKLTIFETPSGEIRQQVLTIPPMVAPAPQVPPSLAKSLGLSAQPKGVGQQLELLQQAKQKKAKPVVLGFSMLPRTAPKSLFGSVPFTTERGPTPALLNQFLEGRSSLFETSGSVKNDFFIGNIGTAVRQRTGQRQRTEQGLRTSLFPVTGQGLRVGSVLRQGTDSLLGQKGAVLSAQAVSQDLALLTVPIQSQRRKVILRTAQKQATRQRLTSLFDFSTAETGKPPFIPGLLFPSSNVFGKKRKRDRDKLELGFGATPSLGAFAFGIRGALVPQLFTGGSREVRPIPLTKKSTKSVRDIL